MVSRNVKKRYRAPSFSAKRRKANANYSSGYNMVIPTRTSTIAKGIPRGPVPRQMRTVLRYCEQQFNINPGLAGAAAAYIFSANGAYDPNITGGGHQARGFDQYMGLYSNYCVLASRIVCHFAPNPAETINLMVGICPLTNSTANTDSRDYIESQGCEYNYLRPGTSGASKMIKCEVDVKTWFDSRNPTDDDFLRGDSSANPTRQLYWHIWASGIGSTDPLTIDATCLIEYDLVFTNPAEVAIS